MPFSNLHHDVILPLNLCDLLVRDVASLIVMSQLISHSLPALRPNCQFSPELTTKLDDILTITRTGSKRLYPILDEAGAVLPAAPDATSCALVTGSFTRLPAGGNPAVLTVEIMTNLRLLAQYIELRAWLAAESSLLVGQRQLSHVLVAWSAEWRACGRALRVATLRARAKAYIADLSEARIKRAT